MILERTAGDFEGKREEAAQSHIYFIGRGLNLADLTSVGIVLRIRPDRYAQGLFHAKIIINPLLIIRIIRQYID